MSLITPPPGSAQFTPTSRDWKFVKVASRSVGTKLMEACAPAVTLTVFVKSRLVPVWKPVSSVHETLIVPEGLLLLKYIWMLVPVYVPA